MLNEKVPYLVNLFSGTEIMASELIRNVVCVFSGVVFLFLMGFTTVSVHK